MGNVSRTQVVKYIRKGDKGEQGAVMRGPQAWSDCEIGYAFQAGGDGEQWKDVVLYNGNYYSCVKSHIKTESNYPNSDADINNHLWQLGDKIELVATKLLLATYALVENLGVTVIDMKDEDGNILFQAKDGNVTCKTGNFENVSITGDLVVNKLRYLANQLKPGTRRLACSFIQGGGQFILPEISNGEYMRVIVYNPLLTRTFNAATLRGSSAKDVFVMSNGAYPEDAVTSVSLQGWYELIGIHDVDRTVWMIQEVRKN